MKVLLVLALLIFVSGINTGYTQKKQKNKVDTSLNQKKKVESNVESNKKSDDGPAIFWSGICGIGLIIMLIVIIIGFKQASKFRKKFYK